MPDTRQQAASEEIGTDKLQATENGISIVVVLTVVGFAAFWAALFSLVFSDAFATPSDDSLAGFIFRLLLLIGFALAQMLSGTRLSDTVNSQGKKLAILALSFACMLALAAFSLMGLETSDLASILQAVIWMLLGFGMGIELDLWGVIWSGIDSERDRGSFCSLAMAASVLVAVGACSAMLFPPSAICIAATSTLFIVSGVLLLLCEKRIPCSEEVSAQASRQRLNLANVAMLTPLAASFALGVILALNGLRLGADLAFFTALAGLGIGALCPLVVTAIREAAPSPSSVERAVFPVICACMLMLPFMTSAQAFQIVIILAIADLTAYFVNHLSVLVLLAYRKHLKPTYHFAKGLTATTCGLALGWAVVTIPFFACGEEMQGYSSAGWAASQMPQIIAGNVIGITLITCMIAVFVIVLVLSIVPYASNRMVEDLYPQVPAEDGTKSDVNRDADMREKACASICNEYGLTPREREVFAYLMRGRNAEYISRELVISIHTAKTHTARIYRKLGINSQQQLLDIAEERIRTARETVR